MIGKILEEEKKLPFLFQKRVFCRLWAIIVRIKRDLSEKQSVEEWRGRGLSDLGSSYTTFHKCENFRKNGVSFSIKSLSHPIHLSSKRVRLASGKRENFFFAGRKRSVFQFHVEVSELNFFFFKCVAPKQEWERHRSVHPGLD